MMTTRADAARELGMFLRARRERLSPADVELPPGARHRRTPGLRREEVADLAGVSVDYVVRIEQGRGPRPSTDVLDCYADALRLSADERAYLLDLAGHRTGTPRAERPGYGATGRSDMADGPNPSGPSDPFDASGPSDASDGSDRDTAARRLIEDVAPLPAMLMNHRFEILAWNREMAGLMMTDFAKLPPQDRNPLLLCLINQRLRDFYLDWETITRACIADLRASWARYPDDPEMARLVDRLLTNDEFARLWKLRDVRVNASGRKRLLHNELGPVTIDYESWAPLQAPDRRVVVYRPADAESAEALKRLHEPGRDLSGRDLSDRDLSERDAHGRARVEVGRAAR